MTNVFTFRMLEVSCGCGGRGERFSGVAVTHAYELAIFWYCPNCNREVHGRVPLETIARMKPEPPDATSGLPTTTDLAMLENHHILWESRASGTD